MFSLVLPAMVACFVAGALGREMFQLVGADGLNIRFPRWLETVSPLRGRWLSYLLAAPGIALVSTVSFVQVFLVTWIVEYLLLAMVAIV